MEEAWARGRRFQAAPWRGGSWAAEGTGQRKRITEPENARGLLQFSRA